MSRQDPKGFYTRLGVAPDASAEDIKKGYRSRAMDLHPDRNQGRDTTRAFQELQEAYNVLSNAKTRAEYDSIGLEEEQRTQTTARRSPDPIVCHKCGCVSAQPRYAIFFEVKSFIFVTRRTARQGIFCASCAAKEALKASAITWVLGWWGFPWGPIWSLDALARNLFGGTQPREHNARILAYQASYFASKGHNDLARAIALDALNLALKIKAPTNSLRRRLGYDTVDAAAGLVKQIKALVLALDDGLPFKRLKPLWGIFNRILAQQGAMAMAFAVAIAIAVIWDEKPRTQTPIPAPTAFRAPATPNPGKFGTAAPSTSPDVSRSAASEIDAKPLPLSKIFKRYVKVRLGDPLPPLKVTTERGGPHCLIKLYDWNTNAPVLSVFIRSGESTEIKVPVGDYRAKVASGETWQGEQKLFGPDTDYSEFDKRLEFVVSGDQLVGKQLELTPRPHGNLHRTKISAADF